jgi:phospholipid/cholesterol/gamma-HCH transport system substrate-binding protein
MEYFRAEVKVGAFIFVALALLVFAAIVVGGMGNWFVAKHRYTVLLPNANLLRSRSQVSYAGYAVGEVVAIAVRSEAERAQQHAEYPVAVTIAVQTAIPLREDARVEMKTEGFIGDRYLDISPGTGAPLPPGGTLLGRLGGVEGMLASLGGLGGGLEDISKALQTLLTDSTQPYSVPATLTSVNRLVDTLLPRLLTLTASMDDLIKGLQQDVARTSSTATQTLQRLEAILADNRGGLQSLVRELHASLTEVQQTVVVLRRVAESSQAQVASLTETLRTVSAALQQRTEEVTTGVQRLVDHADGLLVQNDRNLYVTLENLRLMTDNLKATSQLLRANPAVLLWGNSNPHSPDPANPSPGDQLLQDRGRVGRYDRAP